MSAEHKLGEVGTEIAPELAPEADDAARVDVLLRHVCHLARSLTGAEQAAMALHATADDTPRKYFSLSAVYAQWADFRPDPKGLGLHGLEIPPGDVIRLTQAEVEAHPAWTGFGNLADEHPPMRGWLATAVCAPGADFTEEDEGRIRELADLVGAALDALRFSHERAAA